jgi:hypothetical protein
MGQGTAKMSHPPLPFRGKKIELAPTTGIEASPAVPNDFMRKIFEFEPGEYLITDESKLVPSGKVPRSGSGGYSGEVRRIYGAVMEKNDDFLVNIFRCISENSWPPAGRNPQEEKQIK